MLKTRIFLIAISALLIAALFFLPKAVVENDSQLQTATDPKSPDSRTPGPHTAVPITIRKNINRLRARYLSDLAEEKNAIFADSLVSLYNQAGQFDSAAWFAEKAMTFFKTDESLLKAGNAYYEAYTFAVNPEKQKALAGKTQELFGKFLEKNPKQLEVRTKVAMTYLVSAPMKGIGLLRGVLAEDPNNELALFNMGMLSIQSGQYDKAPQYLEKLIAVNEKHIQGHLLLGVAFMNLGQNEKAREQFERIKTMDSDPAVQSTVDSYLKELK